MYDSETIDLAKNLGIVLQKRAAEIRGARAAGRRAGGSYYEVFEALFALGKKEYREKFRDEGTNDLRAQEIAGYERVLRFLVKIEEWAGKPLESLQDANTALANAKDEAIDLVQNRTSQTDAESMKSETINEAKDLVERAKPEVESAQRALQDRLPKKNEALRSNY